MCICTVLYNRRMKKKNLTKKNITIDELAGMTQRQFVEIERNMATKEDMKLVLRHLENIEEGIMDVRTIRRVDLPVLEDRVEILERDTKNVKRPVAQ